MLWENIENKCVQKIIESRQQRLMIILCLDKPKIDITINPGTVIDSIIWNMLTVYDDGHK